MKKILIIVGALIIFIISILVAKSLTGNSINEEDYDKINIQVNIPCSGHAGLIKYELQKFEGIKKINFKTPNFFDVYYDSTKISPEEILGAGIFKEYPAKIIN